MKLVVNRCFGGFGLSPLAQLEYLKLKGKECFFYIGGLREPYKKIPIEAAKNEPIVHVTTNDIGDNPTSEEMNCEYYFCDRDIERNDADLVAVVEKLGDNANSQFAKLEIVEIPDGIDWEIDDYDGSETVAEKHRTW